MRDGHANWRPWLRALHRDGGYLAVGLTVIYALSGLAVNHVADWDSNFVREMATLELGAMPAATDAAVGDAVRARLHIDAAPVGVYRASSRRVDVTFPHRTVHVDPTSGHATDEREDPRFFLRVANWLHLNRGKPAWKLVADSYAVILLLLALSGMFMLGGRRGLLGRGGLLVLIGAAIPTLYVILSGGP